MNHDHSGENRNAFLNTILIITAVLANAMYVQNQSLDRTTMDFFPLPTIHVERVPEWSYYIVSPQSISSFEPTHLLAHLASSFYLHSRHYDPLVSATTLLLDHLTLRTELLQDALCVAALMRVCVVVAHYRCCGCRLDLARMKVDGKRNSVLCKR